MRLRLVATAALLMALVPTVAACNSPASESTKTATATPAPAVTVTVTPSTTLSNYSAEDDQAYLVKAQELMTYDSGPSAVLDPADYLAAITFGHATCDAKASGGESAASAVRVLQRKLLPDSYSGLDIVDMSAAALMVLCP